jgi:hypothetical protein
MRISKPITLAAVATLATLVAGAATAQVAVDPRSELYSVGGVSRFCTRAQQIVSETSLGSFNINHNDLVMFANSSAAPYVDLLTGVGANTGAFNGTLARYPSGGAFGTPQQQMPLITQQLVTNRVLPNTTWEYPVVISCKMKTAEAITFHFGPGTAGTQKTCREINQDTVARVYATLTSFEQRTLRWAQSEIIYTADFYAGSGPNFLYPLPYLPLVANLTSTGKLRLFGRAIWVPRDLNDGGVGYDKKGSYYCHLPSPEYIRALVTGRTNPILEPPPPDY